MIPRRTDCENRHQAEVEYCADMLCSSDSAKATYGEKIK